tara:strand:- start:148 stop:336 length:189 start_codon:yes stop_codon:yes gene_type:complete
MKIIYYNNKLFLKLDEKREKQQLQKVIHDYNPEIEIDIKNLIPLSESMIKNVSTYWKEKNND